MFFQIPLDIVPFSARNSPKGDGGTGKRTEDFERRVSGEELEDRGQKSQKFQGARGKTPTNVIADPPGIAGSVLAFVVAE